MMFEWKSGQLEHLKQGIRKEGIVKTMFSQKLFFDYSGIDFLCFPEALEVVFLTFAAMETGLQIKCFSRSPWGS